MSDQDKKSPEQGQAPGQWQPQAPQKPAEPEMPMLAASAAARLTQEILSRVNGPHGGHPSTPLRSSALWRQVTRRMGMRSAQQPGRSVPLVRGQQTQGPSWLPPMP